MGFFGGIADMAKGAVHLAAAPVKGFVNIASTGSETSLKVIGDAVTLRPGKAIDDLGNGLKKQGGNVLGMGGEQWSALKGAASGLGESLSSGIKFLGEPIRGAERSPQPTNFHQGQLAVH